MISNLDFLRFTEIVYPTHIETCFHWCNLKPLYKSDNRQKSNKLIDNTIKYQQEFSLHYSQMHNLHYINIYDFYSNFLIK